MTNSGGIYLHIPFCEKKCRYCDFYSGFPTADLLDSYTDALIRTINQWGGKFHRPIDTVYLGGGTPSLLGGRLSGVIEAVKESFSVSPEAEITLELNPTGNTYEVLVNAKKAGINRLSIGMQSGNDGELKILGRCHTVSDTESAVKTARELGFSNISLDLMIGLPESDTETLTRSLEKIIELNPEHISSYILKIEQNTAFYKMAETLKLPDDDSVADQYLYVCEYLENNGYNHYEISNFAKNGMKSRHNLKYWNGSEYLGIGASAHSFIGNERFYYPKDLKGFIKGNAPIPDGIGGTKEEFVMLKLRLSEGISKRDYVNLFGEEKFNVFHKKCETLAKNGLIKIENNRYSLTNEGMLISNSIITEVLA